MRPGRAVLRSLALIVATTGGPGAAVLDDRDTANPTEPRLLVDVRLVTSADLPQAARAVLTREVDDIWRRERVRVRWVPAGADDGRHDVALPVFVVQRERPSGATVHQWPVGELLLDHGGGAVAVASIAAAERALDATGARDEPTALRHRRLGLILGRTVAHEMGHYLLNTNGHARRGLMRARIGTAELADLRSGAFFLDAQAGRWIREWRERHPAPQPPLASFNYAP